MNKSLPKSLGLVLIALAIAYIINRVSAKNDLTRYFELEADLQKVSRVPNATANSALTQYPLTTIGQTPLAGIQIDPFYPQSTNSLPRALELYQPFVSPPPPEWLATKLTDPNAKG
jgi:hypothetical protein